MGSVLALWLGLGGFCPPVFGAVLADQSARARQLASYQEQYRELAEKYTQGLGQIADKAERSGFAKEAKAIRGLAVPFDPEKIQADGLPRAALPDLPVSLPDAERWRLELRQHREDYANHLYVLSRRLLRSKFPSASYRLVREVASAYPDHPGARRILGFQPWKGEWITPFEAEQARKNLVWHEKYGWLLKTYVKRYEDGERNFRGSWMPAAKEEGIRRVFSNAWIIRTENFLIETNHSLERGVEIATKLEEYHDFFVQTFVGFFQTPKQLEDLFNEAARHRRGTKSDAERFHVHYYRTRDEYIQALKQKVPQVAITNGLYHNGDRIAYFYDAPKEDKESLDSTLFHEATHQLLYETRFRNPRMSQGVGDDANFWIVEGIACYMESLKRQAGSVTLGDPEFIRFYWARNRYLKESYYVPLAEFASMGMREFQSHQNISRNYSQASGLVHFFMHSQGGVYRDAMIEHISQIYAPGRRLQSAASLADLTGVSFPELDKQYGDYLRAEQDAIDRAQSRTP